MSEAMDMSSFRVASVVMEQAPTPSVRVSGPTQRTDTELSEIEPTFTAHQAVTESPFSASYLGVDRVFKHLDPPQQNSLRQIDLYIREAISRGEYTDSAKTAANLLKKMEEKLNLTEDHDPYYKADKMARYIKALRVNNQKFSPAVAQAKSPTRKAEAEKITALKSVARKLLNTL